MGAFLLMRRLVSVVLLASLLLDPALATCLSQSSQTRPNALSFCDQALVGPVVWFTLLVGHRHDEALRMAAQRGRALRGTKLNYSTGYRRSLERFLQPLSFHAFFSMGVPPAVALFFAPLLDGQGSALFFAPFTLLHLARWTEVQDRLRWRDRLSASTVLGRRGSTVWSIKDEGESIYFARFVTNLPKRDLLGLVRTILDEQFRQSGADRAWGRWWAFVAAPIVLIRFVFKGPSTTRARLAQWMADLGAPPELRERLRRSSVGPRRAKAEINALLPLGSAFSGMPEFPKLLGNILAEAGSLSTLAADLGGLGFIPPQRDLTIPKYRTAFVKWINGLWIIFGSSADQGPRCTFDEVNGPHVKVQTPDGLFIIHGVYHGFYRAIGRAQAQRLGESCSERHELLLTEHGVDKLMGVVGAYDMGLSGEHNAFHHFPMANMVATRFYLTAASWLSAPIFWFREVVFHSDDPRTTFEQRSENQTLPVALAVTAEAYEDPAAVLKSGINLGLIFEGRSAIQAQIVVAAARLMREWPRGDLSEISDEVIARAHLGLFPDHSAADAEQILLPLVRHLRKVRPSLERPIHVNVGSGHALELAGFLMNQPLRQEFLASIRRGVPLGSIAQSKRSRWDTTHPGYWAYHGLYRPLIEIATLGWPMWNLVFKFDPPADQGNELSAHLTHVRLLATATALALWGMHFPFAGMGVWALGMGFVFGRSHYFHSESQQRWLMGMGTVGALVILAPQVIHDPRLLSILWPAWILTGLIRALTLFSLYNFVTLILHRGSLLVNVPEFWRQAVRWVPLASVTEFFARRPAGPSVSLRRSA